MSEDEQSPQEPSQDFSPPEPSQEEPSHDKPSSQETSDEEPSQDIPPPEPSQEEPYPEEPIYVEPLQSQVEPTLETAPEKEPIPEDLPSPDQQDTADPIQHDLVAEHFTAEFERNDDDTDSATISDGGSTPRIDADDTDIMPPQGELDAWNKKSLHSLGEKPRPCFKKYHVIGNQRCYQMPRQMQPQNN